MSSSRRMKKFPKWLVDWVAYVKSEYSKPLRITRKRIK